MKLPRLGIFAAVMLGTSLAGVNAAIKDLPVREVNGRTYHYYEVASKETVYSLCHKLGISKEELVKYNPAVADGLKSGTVLFFPVDEPETPAANPVPQGKTMITHNVEKGQTIYGIATKYGISTQELIDQNPIVSEGLKAGQVLHISVPAANVAPAPAVSTDAATAASAQQTAPAEPETSGYIVKKKETLYSIANAHGITVKQLEDANPGITVLREGQVLAIPSKASAPALDESRETAAGTAPQTGNGTTSISVDDFAAASGVDTTKVDELSVAVVLPFMLNEETPSKSAQRYTEFYKGFLMAADSLRNNGTPVRISAFDSECSNSKVHSLIADTVLKQHRIIIAPDNAEQLIMLGEFGRANNIKVLNDFLVRDETYMTNPAVMQGNIPSAMMLEKAADAIAERVAYSTPVFLTLTDGQNDKGDFTDALKKRLDARGVAYKEISVEGKLTPAALKSLPADGSYSFIPASGRQSDINRLLPALIEWRDEAVMPMVKVIGYPEWITFRGETLENMHNLNTFVYSRFFDDEKSMRSRRLEEKFKGWYGTGMENAIPRQGMLGFDTGMFVLGYLKNPSKRYDGVQNAFSFSVPEGAQGECNTSLYLINYRPGGLIEKTNL